MQSPDRQIDLFCKLESPDRIHAVIADVLMEGAIRSLEFKVCYKLLADMDLSTIIAVKRTTATSFIVYLCVDIKG